MSRFKGEYPVNWEAMAREVKAEANHRCVRCGHDHAPTLGRTLTVHHFDGDKSNGAKWNLMALCQACHLSVQSRVDPRMPLMFTPATWSMPYIAGFYEAGCGVPGPLYDLRRWIEVHERERGPWPAWAPRPG